MTDFIINSGTEDEIKWLKSDYTLKTRERQGGIQYEEMIPKLTLDDGEYFGANFQSGKRCSVGDLFLSRREILDVLDKSETRCFYQSSKLYRGLREVLP
jgi:hypothetical protein